MPRIDHATISTVLDAYGPERARLIQLLATLDDEQWAKPTECPAYSVKGIASHILGDDLSLLSRQRDGAAPGLVLMAERMPGTDFRALLDGFNDQWVDATGFLSPALLLQLLDLTGQWTHRYYCDVDPSAPGEPVPMFGVSFATLADTSAGRPPVESAALMTPTVPKTSGRLTPSSVAPYPPIEIPATARARRSLTVR